MAYKRKPAPKGTAKKSATSRHPSIPSTDRSSPVPVYGSQKHAEAERMNAEQSARQSVRGVAPHRAGAETHGATVSPMSGRGDQGVRAGATYNYCDGGISFVAGARPHPDVSAAKGVEPTRGTPVED